MKEAAIWLNLHNALPKLDSPEFNIDAGFEKWQKPPPSFLKCNVGSSWDGATLTCGGEWLVRDEQGNVLLHSRRSFSQIESSLQAKLVALQWAAAAMCDLKLKKVIIESSALEIKNSMDHPQLSLENYTNCSYALSTIHSIMGGSLSFVPISCNNSATTIADSVTRDQRHHSYVAWKGTRWLSSQIRQEASA